MIRILDKHVADKIAAGEVIDRPVSIVKELLENALDAGASSITVEIKNGGKRYIRATDNGCGIPAEEAELAFVRHATSKITAVEDLDAIGTLGFRGEALASICAVSRVELITRTADSKVGRRIVAEGSSILENKATGCPAGTTVTVRDLFYNVPARSKFLASDSAETRRITDMVSRIALSYGDVRFNLINGGTRVFSTMGKGNVRNNIISIYGSDAARDLLPVDLERNGALIRGFVSSPAVSAPSRARQIFCVNGRVVSSDVLEKALDAAYKEKLFHGRFPIAYLFLAMPPDRLDVNVHPTKKEIRFDDPFETADFVTEAIRRALHAKEALPQIREDRLDEPAPKVAEPLALSDYKAASPKKRIPEPKVSVKEEQVDIRNILSTIKRDEMAETKKETSSQEELRSKEGGSDSETCASSAKLQTEQAAARPFDLDDLHYMGALFNTYIIATDEDSFYLIDQHAAHERVFYEKLLQEYNNRQKLSQTLLIPLTFNVSAQVAASEDIWLQEVRSMGYDVDFFGSNTYLVREVPAFMELKEAEDFLSDLFTALEDKPDLTNRKILEKIITRSCKSAVKGGDALTEEEIASLIKDLKNCANPFSCPHGRPTFIRMHKYEIEKRFKRV